jgi:glutathione S-transferase
MPALHECEAGILFYPDSFMSHPVLYSFRRCPYAMRARLAIAVSAQTCQLREIVLRNKPAAMLAASPKGTVPVLVLPSGQVLEQSLDIMLWALHQNDPSGWLEPAGCSLANMLALVDSCEQDFKCHLDRYKYPQRYDLEHGLQHRNQAADWLMTLEGTLSLAPYLSGMHCALADMAIAPFVRQFAHTDFAWFEAQAWPHVLHWLENWKQSEIFARVMHKYSPWEHGQTPVLFP